MFELKIKNITFIAALNPLNFNKDWFVKNDVLKETEIISETIISTASFFQIGTADYNILITSNQIIFNLIKDSDKELQSLKKLMLGVSNSSYRAIGINFTYFSPMANEKGEDWTKKLFYTNTPLHALFNSDDSRFGTYLSKDYQDCRLKLDIKPSAVQELPSSELKEVILYTFNYHKDTINKSNEDLIKFIDKYSELKGYSESILNTIYKQ